MMMRGLYSENCMVEPTAEDVSVYVYSRGYSGGLVWSRINLDGRQVPADAPVHVEQLESFIDVANPALVLAECEGDKLVLLLWNLPSDRSANAGRYVSTSLFLVWRYHDKETCDISSQTARAVAAAWLDPQMHDRFLNLVNSYIEDDDYKVTGTEFTYSVTREFSSALRALIKDALTSLAGNRAPSYLPSKVKLDSLEERKQLAHYLREFNLPRSKSAAGSCMPLVIVTCNKLPVEGVWQMLTGMPALSATELPKEDPYSSLTEILSCGANGLARVLRRGLGLSKRSK